MVIRVRIGTDQAQHDLEKKTEDEIQGGRECIADQKVAPAIHLIEVEGDTANRPLIEEALLQAHEPIQER